MNRRPSARELLDRTLDTGSFASWDTPPVDVRPDPGYAADLAAARERSGCDEAVITGEGLLRGRRVAIIACEFSFLAGSIGVAAAERLVVAIERATAERLPLLAAPASGGTRMQEGTVAFLAMVKISAAIAAHKAAGLPYLVYLRHPTTGGVLASWGSQGHVTVAEPGALIGFLGPRVYEALYDRPFPEGVQVAENLHRSGLIDAVLQPEDVPAIAERAFNVLLARAEGLPEGPEPVDEPIPDVPAWDSIVCSRRPGRPGVRALLRHAATDVVPSTAPARGSPIRGCCWRSPGSAGPRACCWARTATARAWSAHWGRPRCARLGGACGSRESYGCRWSRSSTPPGPRCPRRPKSAGWPARSRAAWPNW